MKKPDIPSACPKLINTVVSSPTVPGAIENVKRVVDTIEAMHRRRQLGASSDKELRILENDRSYRAAMRLRAAHDVVTGSIGGVMDFDRVRSGGGLGAPPPLHYREAADDLLDARKVLDDNHHHVVQLVVCEGHSIDFATQWIYGNSARAAREEVGALMRGALQSLADHWYERAELPGKSRVRRFHAADADPRTIRYSTDATSVQRGKTVTATRNRIYRG